MRRHPLGIYEKALPRNTSWVEKLAWLNLAVLILLRCR